MATITSLAVNLIAQTNRFTQPLKSAERTVKAFNSSIDRTVDRLQRVENATAKARTRFLALAAAVTVATHKSTEYAGAIIAVHEQTGLAVESVQSLRFAAERSSTDIKTLETGLRSLVRRAAEARQGNLSFAKGFDRLGVSVTRADGSLKDTETLLMEIADGAQRMATEAEASAALMLVMGDAGRRLVPFMRQGSAGVRDLMDEAVALGIVMDENAIAALDALGDQIGTTGNRFGAISRDIAYRFSPAVMVALGWVNQLQDQFFALSDAQRQNIVRWTVYIGMILGAVTAVGVLARVLIAGMGIMRAFATVLALVFSPIVLYTALAIAAIALFKTAWENDWQGIRTAAENAWEKIEPIRDALSTAWDWAIDIAGDAWDWLTDTTWTEKVEDMKRWLTDGWDWAVNLAGDGWDFVKQFLPGGTADFIEGRLRFLVEATGAVYDSIKTGLQTGDWSGLWGATADAWREGMRIGLSLFLVARTAQTVLAAIKSALGLGSAAATGLGAGLRAFGMPGVLGTLSIAIALMDAEESGSYERFGKNLIVALAAGIGIGAFTGSPKLGALAFTIVLNFELGTWIGDQLETLMNSPQMQAVRQLVGTAPSLEGETLLSQTRGEAPSFADRQTFLEPAPTSFWEQIKRRFRAFGFQSGGYTGNGPVDQIAGVVHGQELVIPAPAVKRGLDGILGFLGVPGFQEGRGEGFLRSSLEALRPTIEGIQPGLTDTLINGLEALANGVDFAKERFDELMQAIEDGPEAFQDLFDAARKRAEEDEIAARQQDAMNGLVATLLARMPVLNQMLQGMQAGATFGPAGMAVGALAALAMQSETAATAFGMVNEILGALASAVGMVLRPLLPLIYVLQAVLVPVFNVLGTVLESLLLPIMPILFEGLRWLGVVVLFVGEVFQRVRAMILDAVGGLIVGIAKFINSIPFLSANTMLQSGRALQQSAQAARDSADEMNKARRDLIGLTYEEAMARADNIDAIESTTAAMRGIPSGFKYALERFEAATARPAPPNLSSHYVAPAPEPAVSGAGGQPQVVLHFHGDVYGMEDFDRKVNRAVAEHSSRVRGSSYGF